MSNGKFSLTEKVVMSAVIIGFLAGWWCGFYSGHKVEQDNAISAGVASYVLVNPHSDQTKFLYKTLTIKLDSTH